MSGPGSAEDASRRAAHALVTGADLDSEDFMALRRALARHARFVVGGDWPDALLLEAVDDSLEKFIRAALTGRIDLATALPYLRRIVHNEAISRIRREWRYLPIETAQPGGIVDEDAVARMIDERATAATIERLLAQAAARRDFAATRVMNAYLKLAESLGAEPSIRQVARAAAVSHSGARKILNRLKKEITDSEFPK